MIKLRKFLKFITLWNKISLHLSFKFVAMYLVRGTPTCENISTSIQSSSFRILGLINFTPYSSKTRNADPNCIASLVRTTIPFQELSQCISFVPRPMPPYPFLAKGTKTVKSISGVALSIPGNKTTLLIPTSSQEGKHAICLLNYLLSMLMKIVIHAWEHLDPHARADLQSLCKM